MLYGVHVVLLGTASAAVSSAQVIEWVSVSGCACMHYNPLKNGKFVAESGLPEAIRGGGTFTVLGIESSCDDTGGELMYRVLMTLSVVVTFCVLMM